MKPLQTTISAFLAGLVAGLVAYHGALFLGGRTLVDRDFLNDQQTRLDALKEENLELTDELFGPRGQDSLALSLQELPYDGEADAASMVSTARMDARAERKYLMVTFGANWCLDCRTLHHHLNSEPVAGYVRDLFRFVNVDVGKFNQNRDVAETLGISLTRGIPVAVFFDPDGEVIGTTNDGQLEPSRRYSSKQILKFVRDIAERDRILAPDSVE